MNRVLLTLAFCLSTPLVARPDEIIRNLVEDFDATSDNIEAKVADAIATAASHFEQPDTADDVFVLYFPAGDYEFVGIGVEVGPDAAKPSQKVRAAIAIESFRNGKLVLRGADRESTTFTIHRNQDTDPNDEIQSKYGLFVRNSSNITIEGIHWTVAQPTFSQGIVRAVESGYVDLEIQTGFAPPIELEPDRVNSAGRYLRKFTNDPDDPQVVEEVSQVAWSFSQNLGERCYRVHLTNRSIKPLFDVGDLIAIKAKHGRDIFRVVNSDHITIRNCRFSRKTRGVVLNSPDSVFENVIAVRGPAVSGQTPCLVSSDGGPQFHASPGGGLKLLDGYTKTRGTIVRDCQFSGTGDDAIGLFFQQDPVIAGNIIRDSFARGIFQYETPSVFFDSEKDSEYPGSNRVTRAPPQLQNQLEKSEPHDSVPQENNRDGKR